MSETDTDRQTEKHARPKPRTTKVVVWRIDTQLPVPERRPHTHPSRRKPMPQTNTHTTPVTLPLPQNPKPWNKEIPRLICGRRLGTGSCVSIRQTTSLVVRGLGRAFLCLSVCLSPPPSPSRVPVFLAHLLPFDSSPHRKLLLPRGVQARDARVCPDAHIGVQRHVAIVSLAFRCLHRDSERRCMACEMR